ncbi:uncharacterized protein KY384_007585 [Bacidia gigantensis]|uniref:uncharacterized protein n=1 Tax=Bacidia gigantensis TaxID=2732470 RepID=UPI001D046AB1|nr:uncharacterized protein KY384_007585 [Bacidia gigantensis]KAG8527433.1 hypothetical protein KY384_007585 [Bacidia gigantensis]
MVFPFLSLPAEIRLEIYSYLGIVKRGGRYIGASETGKPTHSDKFKAEVQRYRRSNYQLICRQINNELLHTFYAKNGFEIFQVTVFLDFMQSIGAEYRQVIKRLRIHFSSYASQKNQRQAVVRAFKGFRYVLSCTSLEKLEINVRFADGYRRSWLSYAVKEPQQLLFHGSVAQNVEFEEAQRCGRTFRNVIYEDLDASLDAQVDNVKRTLTEALHEVVRERQNVLTLRRRSGGVRDRQRLPALYEGKARAWTGKAPCDKGLSLVRRKMLLPKYRRSPGCKSPLESSDAAEQYMYPPASSSTHQASELKSASADMSSTTDLEFNGFTGSFDQTNYDGYCLRHNRPSCFRCLTSASPFPFPTYGLEATNIGYNTNAFSSQGSADVDFGYHWCVIHDLTSEFECPSCQQGHPRSMSIGSMPSSMATRQVHQAAPMPVTGGQGVVEGISEGLGDEYNELVDWNAGSSYEGSIDWFAGGEVMDYGSPEGR